MLEGVPLRNSKTKICDLLRSSREKTKSKKGVISLTGEGFSSWYLPPLVQGRQRFVKM